MFIMLEALLAANLAAGPLFTTFILGCIVVLLLLWSSSKKQTYWKEVGIPYVEPVPFLGSVYANIQKPLHELEKERYKELGKIYGRYEGNSPVITIADLEIVRKILVKDFHAFSSRRPLDTGDPITEKMVNFVNGEDWKRIRTIITPTFTTGKIKRMIGIFKECSQTLVGNFKEAHKKGEPIQAKKLYGAFTMDVIASALFSSKIDSHNDPENEFVQTAKTVFGGAKINWKFVIFLLVPWLLRFFKVRIFDQNAIKFFSRITLEIIEERKKTGQKRNDFLQLLLDTAEEVAKEGKLDLNEKDDLAENYGKDESQQMFKPYISTKKTLTQNELIAQCVIFFLAGYETTASTLAFVSYSLALNPEVQEKLIQELDDAIRENNGELTYEAIQSMKYLNNVISETLRIYPPAARLERRADEDYKLDTGFTIPKGMMVYIPVHALHSDPKLFPNPEKFEPDRFTHEERVNRDQYSYMPFGAGPRNCVGMRFALMELKVCLATVLSNFRFRKCPETKVPLEFHSGHGLLQPKDITIALEERKDAVQAS